MAASIPKNAIKALVKKYAKANITDDGAEELAKILNQKAMEISAFAVKEAEKESRKKITKKDILKYSIKIDSD
jgi:histone H3/H4